MKKTLSILIAATMSVGGFLYSQSNDAKPKPLRVLIVTGGCCHDYANQQGYLKAGIESRINAIVDVAYNPSIGHVAALSGATGLESLNLISSGASGVLDLTRQEHLSSLRLEGNPTLKLVVLPEQCGELSFLSYDPDANVVRGRLCTAVIDLHNPD